VAGSRSALGDGFEMIGRLDAPVQGIGMNGTLMWKGEGWSMGRRCYAQVVMALLFWLWLTPTSLVLGQDDDGDDDGTRVKVLEPEGRGSRPGVVQRERPSGDQGTAPTPVTPEGAGGAQPTPATPALGQERIDYGERIDIEGNFGSDFDVRPVPRATRFTLDFRDADLSDVVKLMSAQTGRNFIIADSLRAGKKITIISPNPVGQGEAYQAFLSALQMNGLTVVRSGQFYKIVDINAGLKEPIEALWPGDRVPTNDALVTRIIELQHVDISQIKPVMDQLKTPTGLIVEYSPTNTLIVTDTGNSVRRMLAILERLDSSSADAEKIWIYQVQYADANEISSLLGQVFQQRTPQQGGRPQQAQPGGAPGGEADVVISQIVADERTNKLIIVANERSYERIKRLILKLDVELPESGRINVVHLQNSDATDLARVLSELSTQLQPQDPRRGQAAPQASSSSLLQGEVSVVANEATNDLIIVASPRDFMAMRSVIRELDRPRRQVFVEAVILEVSIDRTRSLGTVLHGGNVFETDDGDAYLLGRTELNGKQSLAAGPMFLGSGSAPGLLAALIGPTIDLGPLEIPSFSVLLNALQTNTDVNVLSTPTILTLDNEQAEISVGERIPFLTSSGMGSLNTSMLGGSSADLAGAASLLTGLGGYGTQISRVDVALTLRIKPQINESGAVRLEVEEEIEEVKPGGADLGGPTTRRRNLKTVVIVQDQQTVVLGGLMRDSETQSVSKVPILGDIPVIGYLFRSTETSIQKQNLLLMLTPYVIESEADLEKIRVRKMQEREEFLNYFGRKDLNYVKSVDFDKKHGPLEEIRQVIDATEREANALRDAAGVLDFRVPDEGIDLPEGLDDGYGGVAGGNPGESAPAGGRTGQRPGRAERQGGRRVPQGR